MAEKAILDIEIPVTEIDKATAAIGRMRKKVEDLKKAQKKSTDVTTKAYTQNAVEIKALNGEIRNNERVLLANKKMQDANKGSVEQLRTALTIASEKWKGLSKDERENTKAGKDLVKTKTDLTNTLKRLEKQTGDNRRNVGNYSEGMREGLKTSGLFSRQQQALATAQATYTTVTKGATSATKLFKIALISTGIGAVVVLVGSLVAAFLSTQRGMDAVNKVLKPLTFAFQRILGVFQKVATALADLDFAKALREFKLFGSEIKKGTEDGKKFADSQIALKDAQLALAKVQGKLNRAFSEQKLIVQDVTKSELERIKAGDAALEALQKRTDLEAAVLKEQIKQAKLATEQNDTDRDAKIELATLEGELDQLEAKRLNESLRIKNQINGINKKLATDSKKAVKEQTVLIKEEAQVVVDSAKQVAETLKRTTDTYLLEQKRLLLDGVITREEYNQSILEKEVELLEGQLALRKYFNLDTLEIETALADAQIALKEKVANAAVQAAAAGAETESNISQDLGDQKINLANQGVEIAKQAAGENVAAQKAAALATAGINIAEAITKIQGQTGVLAPVFTLIQAALGAIQVAKINATQVPSFAKGVIGLDGGGTETSDSISAKLSKGESVLTARATRAFAPDLAAMEIAVGNKPNYQLGNRRFAGGLIGVDRAASVTRARSLANDRNSLASDLEKMEVFLSLTELDERNTELKQATNKAQIVQ